MTFPDLPEGAEGYPGPPSRRQAIPATCQLDGGPVNPTTLMVTKHDGTIRLDPDVVGSCAMILEEDAATKLRDMLKGWLRRTGAATPSHAV